MFAYNTSFHRSIQNTPHFLTYGIQARQPAFFQEDLNRKFYGENTTDELTQRLQYARQIAEQNNEYATSKMQEQFNRKAQPHSFSPGQWVLLRDFTVLGKNAKLAPRWKGPFKIISLRGSHNLLIHLADGKRTKLVNIENVKPYHEAPEKPVYNLQRPENEENSETEMGEERTHHVRFEENIERQNFDQADETPEYETFFQRGEGLAANQNFEQSEPPRRVTRSQARRMTESEGREQSIMPQLRRARTMTETETETEAEGLIEMGLEEDVSGDLQTTVEAVTSDKNANYLFVIKTEKTMKKKPKLIKPQTMSATLISAIKADPDDPISRRQAREKSIKVLIDYYVSIDTEPKWTRQQWRNFIDTGDVDLSRPYPEYRLIGIEPSVEINLPQANPAPAPIINNQGPIVQANQPDHQDGPEDQEEVRQPAPKPAVPRAKKVAPPASGFFGALVGGFANVFAEDSSSDDSPPASPATPVAGPSGAARKAPYQKAGLSNLAAATRASFRNTGRQLDPDIVHRYPEDRKNTPSKKK